MKTCVQASARFRRLVKHVDLTAGAPGKNYRLSRPQLQMGASIFGTHIMPTLPKEASGQMETGDAFMYPQRDVKYAKPILNLPKKMLPSRMLLAGQQLIYQIHMQNSSADSSVSSSSFAEPHLTGDAAKATVLLPPVASATPQGTPAPTLPPPNLI